MLLTRGDWILVRFSAWGRDHWFDSTRIDNTNAYAVGRCGLTLRRQKLHNDEFNLRKLSQDNDRKLPFKRGPCSVWEKNWLLPPPSKQKKRDASKNQTKIEKNYEMFLVFAYFTCSLCFSAARLTMRESRQMLDTHCLSNSFAAHRPTGGLVDGKQQLPVLLRACAHTWIRGYENTPEKNHFPRDKSCQNTCVTKLTCRLRLDESTEQQEPQQRHWDSIWVHRLFLQREDYWTFQESKKHQQQNWSSSLRTIRNAGTQSLISMVNFVRSL